MTRAASEAGKILVISDLAFDCAETARVRGFSTLTRYNAFVRERWHQAVSPRDTVYVLGNFARGRSAKFVLNRVRNLPGRVVLLQGEIDPDGVGPSILNLAYGKRGLIVLCHYPLEDWERRARRSFHVHGHVPSCDVASGTRRANVYAEALNYTPTPLSDVLDACDPWVAMRKQSKE